MLIRTHILISGRVQKVGFRYWTRQRAIEAGAVGWVKNLSDGRVEAIIEGEKKEVNRLVRLIKKGPPLVRVERMDVKFENPKGTLQSFEIVR